MGSVWRNNLLCLVVAAIFLIPISTGENAGRFGTDNSISTKQLDGGWFEEQNGVKILHLNGSYYNMGYQHGFILKEEIKESMRTQLAFFEEHGFPYEKILETGNIMNNYLPHEYIDEMQGMAEGASIPFEDVVVLNTMPAMLNIVFAEACCEISLWGNATADGKLLHVRSWDWSLDVLDPETDTSLQENMVLIVRTPEVGYTSLSVPENPGAITSWNGVNEKGIVVGENTCLTDDITYQGISPAFRMRMVLDRCATGEEAIDILTSNRTCGTNFILSDANAPIGYALDQTANISYVGTWNDTVEGTDPFWQIEDVTRRTPGYIDPECAAVELDRIRYDPSGLRAIWDALTGKSYMVFPWIHYRALSNQIEKYYGTLDVNSTMMALREEYTGEADFWMLLATTIGESYQCLCQWVLCPETGDMVISFASPDARACYEPVHYFNMYNLMNGEPRPTIEITRPQDGYLNIGLREIGPTLSGNTLIIGRTPVKTSAFYEKNVDKVEFYLDDQLIETVTETPFAAMLDETAVWKHTILAKAYYTDGSSPTDQMDVIIFNI